MELLRNNQIGTPIGNLCFVLPNLVHHHCLTAGAVFCSKLNFSDLHIHHCSFSLCISIKQITHEISLCKELLVVCHALFGEVGPNYFKQFLIREEGQHPLPIFWICNVEVPFLYPQHLTFFLESLGKGFSDAPTSGTFPTSIRRADRMVVSLVTCPEGPTLACLSALR